jgi:two-component system, OmpR family, response regulator RpaA
VTAATRTRSGLGETVFTTGQVARLCNVCPRTVAKWFDSGRLKGHCLPGSVDRRIPAADLRRFLLDHGFPLPPALLPATRLAVGLLPTDRLPRGFALLDVFTAGAVVSSGPVAAALVGDAEGLSVAVRVATTIRAMHPAAAVSLVVSEDAPDPVPGWGGRVLRRPCDLSTWEG